ncbi:MAG: diadenylate cyclase CdaA [Nitrospiraceae bacterium]|nr:diadenylate cyclase CdaA [Nitrospiraceae bacterium]
MGYILRQFSLYDALDILLVAIVLYRLLLIIKGTKAAQMLIGLALLLAVSIVARYLNLLTLDWLLQSFWSYIVIALIIIFQPEIRRTLAKMGETSLLQKFTTAEELKSIEEIVRAAVSLANRKIGGLIVIERETELKDFIEIGIPLDAKVSREILLSIFHPTSPIHDGAAIIRGNRIAAAGCFLPITLTTGLRKALGTRHRAALGITEETDAVSIVVSEETGSISVGMNGTLTEHLDMTTLRQLLTEAFTTKKAESAHPVSGGNAG